MKWYFTPEQYRYARDVAALRRTDCQLAHKTQPHGEPRTVTGHPLDLLRVDIVGACGEYAVALELGIPWEPSLVRDKDVGDVCGLHVRATEWAHGLLRVHETDPEGTWVLAVVDFIGGLEYPPMVYVAGQASAATVRQERFRKRSWERGEEKVYGLPQYWLTRVRRP